MLEFRAPTPDDFDELFARDGQAFIGAFNDDQKETWKQLLPLDRFRTAWDGSDLVGAAGSFALELTMPGGAQVPMGGTTWVSVAPTHRRQGILRRLMDDVHSIIDQRGEPVAGLQASEGSIYGRFGYGIATRRRQCVIDRRRMQIAEEQQPSPGSVRMIDPLKELDRLAELFDRYRRSRVGEISRSRAWIEMRIREERSPVWGALHDDGYVLWTVKENWNNWDARHELTVQDLVACSPDAHAALWHLVLSHDLVGPVQFGLPLDDRLPYLLTDPRGVRTTALNDFLWLCPLDVAALASARRYRIDASMVIDVDGDRLRIEGGLDGAEVRSTNDTADLSMTRAGFGALMMGGVSATELASGGQLEGAKLALGDAFFGWSPAPTCSTPF